MILTERIGTHTILIECADSNAEQARALLMKLRQLHSAGPPLRAGSKIQFGWSVLSLQQKTENTLRVVEPDFDGDISATRPVVDVTLEVLKAQVGLLHSVREEGVDARYDQMIIATRNWLETPDLFLKRDLPQFPEDTGWFIGYLDDLEAARPPHETQALYVYELLILRPALMQLLALPPGYLAIVNGETIRAVLDKDLKVRLGHYRAS
jgi:hypothetical protein